MECGNRVGDGGMIENLLFEKHGGGQSLELAQ